MSYYSVLLKVFLIGCTSSASSSLQVRHRLEQRHRGDGTSCRRSGSKPEDERELRGQLRQEEVEPILGDQRRRLVRQQRRRRENFISGA